GEAFSLYGVSAEVLTSATPQKDRQSIIARFVAGEIRCLANVAVLTTGFNAPQTDLIALLTATKSASKYVQILGRGMRIAPDKADCLVLDYGGNVERFGPVESVEPLRKGSDGKKRTPYKTCPECREHVPTGVRVCPSCGHEFPRPSPALYPEASSAKAYRGLDFTEPCWVQVDDVLIGRHRKPLKPDSIKMTFLTEIGQIRHWLTLDHSPHSKRISSRYVFLAGGKANNTEDALAEADSWNVPSQILVQKSGRWFRVLKFRFEKETI
ncbi:DEAD/DEAH box helicase, partial [Thiocapsa sp. N5-Cardenillas]|uniref:DEAD/DEAH box helicase n=1 Tax=Thiocapsa sp. N5-Cardenillas TaxID=3137397 RepID=UPI0035AD9237